MEMLKMLSETITPSCLKKGVAILLFTSLVVFSTLDALIFRQFVPHIPMFVSRTIQDIGSISPIALNSSLVEVVLVNQTSVNIASQPSSGVAPSSKGSSNISSSTAKSILDIQALQKEQTSLREKLKTMGYDLAEDHEFKSPYIITPKIYPLASGKAPSKSPRKTKVISCFNCPNWFVITSFNQYNRDFKACPYSECTFDAKYKSTADVVLFFTGQIGKRPVPKRPPGQIWAKCYWEAPDNYGYPAPYDPWKSQFNWTFNYRADSDIFAPNNLLAWRNSEELLSDQEYLKIAKMKTKTAAWWVSNCHTKSKRGDYVKEMQKYIDVDIYGKCGPLKCTKTKIDECERMLTTTYKFYLSFENALCKDYVTEKFFRNFAYRSHIIPVGRSGFDYGTYIPEGAFVEASKFNKAKDLALHLKELGSDAETYAKMLKEKDRLVTLNRKYDWCDICEKVHTTKESKIIPDIKDWSHKGTCTKPNDII